MTLQWLTVWVILQTPEFSSDLLSHLSVLPLRGVPSSMPGPTWVGWRGFGEYRKQNCNFITQLGVIDIHDKCKDLFFVLWVALIASLNLYSSRFAKARSSLASSKLQLCVGCMKSYNTLLEYRSWLVMITACHRAPCNNSKKKFDDVVLSCKYPVFESGI